MIATLKKHVTRYMLPAFVLTLSCNSIFAAEAIAGGTADDINRQNTLIDQERDLKRQSDELSRDIFELKGSINQLSKQLEAKQDSYRQINHALITLHMELLQ